MFSLCLNRFPFGQSFCSGTQRLQPECFWIKFLRGRIPPGINLAFVNAWPYVISFTFVTLHYNWCPQTKLSSGRVKLSDNCVPYQMFLIHLINDALFHNTLRPEPCKFFYMFDIFWVSRWSQIWQARHLILGVRSVCSIRVSPVPKKKTIKALFI